jgi:hypothetical protein
MSDTPIDTEPLSFFDLYSRGLVEAEAIDDWVGRWHDGGDQPATARDLHEYLGLTLPEYQVWVYDPDALPYLLNARRSKRALEEIVEERLAALNAADCQADLTVVRGLRAWLDMLARAPSTTA